MPSRYLALSICVCLLTAASPAFASRSVTLAWDPNPEPEVKGYEIFYGRTAGQYESVIDVGTATTHTVSGLDDTTPYYFAVCAYTGDGLRSDLSVAVLDTPSLPPAPTPTPVPALTVSRSTLAFSAVLSSDGHTVATTPQTVFVGSSSGMRWSVVADRPWILVSAASGIGSGAFAVQLAPGTPLAPGRYSGTVTIQSTDWPGLTRTITISASVGAAGSGTRPWGSMDTPVPGAMNVAGALPVTGWALDDVEVQRVEIWRDPVRGEAGGRIPVGTATFVPDARPDIEATYPAHPLAYRAGWGYMLLTNMLPDQISGRRTGGTGRFTLHAYAVDAEGQKTLLGSRTIECANHRAVLPFGTIDTPAEGAVISGKVVNFGWALSPGGTIAEDGSTITVHIDSVAGGHPTYGQYRHDIATLFPGYANSTGAIGYYMIDTTTLANGLHTIAWSVTDVQGRTQGIGSRYFTVANGISGTAQRSGTVTLSEKSGTVALSGGLSAESVTVPLFAPLITAEELEPVQVDLGNGAVKYEGFLRAGGTLKRLPVGSTLNPVTGAFTWRPGPGFSGTYHLVFVRTYASGEREEVPATVVLGPRGGARRRQ